MKNPVLLFIVPTLPLVFLLWGCSGRGTHVDAKGQNAQASAPRVGVTAARREPISQSITLSSELVPFQEIDVFAKESGFVKELLVDFGSRVRAGQLMAVLEIPELEAVLQQSEAAITAQKNEVVRATHDVERVRAQHDVAHLQFTRLDGVSKTQPGLVAQQEVDDARAKDLAAESQMEAAQGALAAAKGQLAMAEAKLAHDQAIYAYTRITAPFDGVVTQRYANLGALMQAGTTSNQATPLVRLSQVNLFRLVIPIPETYVKYIKIGGTVEVRVPSLGHSFTGKVTRFSLDVSESTRTMHTEVDVENRNNELVPGLYAEAVVNLVDRPQAVVVPLQALSTGRQRVTVMVVNSQNKIEERNVTVGLRTANDAEILSGINEGESVVITDRSALKAGDDVTPQQTEPMNYRSTGNE